MSVDRFVSTFDCSPSNHIVNFYHPTEIKAELIKTSSVICILLNVVAAKLGTSGCLSHRVGVSKAAQMTVHAYEIVPEATSP